MYYHICIDCFDKKLKKNQTLYEYDYSTKEEVMERIVAPYVAEKKFFFSGVSLAAEDCRRLGVYETERDIMSMVNIANRNVEPGIFYVYDNEELIHSSQYSKDITKEVIQSAVASVEKVKAAELAQTIKEKRQPLLFISHSSVDEVIVSGLVEMLRTLGFNKQNLFCSSFPGYDIPEGEDIFEYLHRELLEHDLFVIYVLSEAYYKSAACLNEMGAAWVLKADYSTVILPGFQIPEIKGAVNPRKMAIVVEDRKRVNGKLTQLKDRLIEFFDLPETEDDIIWEGDRDKFIKIANGEGEN